NTAECAPSEQSLLRPTAVLTLALPVTLALLVLSCSSTCCICLVAIFANCCSRSSRSVCVCLSVRMCVCLFVCVCVCVFLSGEHSTACLEHEMYVCANEIICQWPCVFECV